MTPSQIDLVQQTFESVRPIAQQAARLFYGRLFELDPALRPLFRGDMEEQGRKLMQLLAAGVASLRRPAEIAPSLEDLGRRHAGYGVKDEHYDTVGAALLWTLEQGLGPAFTLEVRDAWAALYSFVRAAMLNGTRTAATA